MFSDVAFSVLMKAADCNDSHLHRVLQSPSLNPPKLPPWSQMVFAIMSPSASLVICTICFSPGARSRRCQSQTRAVNSLAVGLFVNSGLRHVDAVAKHLVMLHRGALIFGVDLWAPFSVCVCVCVCVCACVCVWESERVCVCVCEWNHLHHVWKFFGVLWETRKVKYLRTKVKKFLNKIRCLCVQNSPPRCWGVVGRR